MNRLSVWGRGEKLQGEGREKVWACRQTFEAAILPSCLVIADHLSARSLSVTWIQWNVINFACKNGVKQKATHNFYLMPKCCFFQWVFSCSGGFWFNWEKVIFASHFIMRGHDKHIDFLWLLFLVGVICPLMQGHSLWLNMLISQVPEDTMLKIRKPVYKWLYKSNYHVLCADQKSDVNQTCQQSAFLLIGACIRIWCTVGAVEWQSPMFVYRLSLPSSRDFFTLSQTESRFTG